MFGSRPAPTDTPLQINAAMKRGDVVLVDVRERNEHAAECIEGALLRPLSQFDAAALPQAGVEIVLHCGSGKRSQTAFEACRRAGVTVRSHMAGGIQAWKAAGLPVAPASELRDGPKT